MDFRNNFMYFRILIAFTLSYIGVTGENKILSLDTKLILLVGPCL